MNPLRRSASSPLQGEHTSRPAQPVPRCALDERVEQLVVHYRRVQAERMHGIPILNPALSVEAVGFRLPEDDAAWAEGVLVTPWFMSLVRLPLEAQDHGGRVGRKRVLPFGTECFDFIGAHDAALGFHEACALFSPMANFRSQDEARDTAMAVLAHLSPPAPAPSPAAEPVPARRAFFLGRSMASAGGRA